jgi:hypothetical protein
VRAALRQIISVGAITLFVGEEAPATAAPQPALIRSPVAVRDDATAAPPATATPQPSPTAASLVVPGRRVTLAGAQAMAQVPLRLPTYPQDLGAPDRIFANEEVWPPVVIFVWDDPDDPEQARLSLYHILAPQYGRKAVTWVEDATVAGRPAYWIAEPHRFQRTGPGAASETWQFVAGNVLVWWNDAVTYRLEGAPSLQEAVRIADSLQPVDAPAATPAPLTHDAMISCPASLPNLSESPDEYYISREDGYGNPQRTMFIGLWPGGKIYFFPGGPGSQAPGGPLGMKFWFYRTVPGDVVIGGRRLDAPAPPMPETVLRGEEDGYGETGFHPAGLVFPTPGCWEVTARIGEETMTFVTLVVTVPFAPLRPAWLPEELVDEGLRHVDTDVSDLPQAFHFVYGFRDGREGKLIVETRQGAAERAPSYPEGALQWQGTVAGSPTVCLAGAWDSQSGWRDAAASSVLLWSGEGFGYRLVDDGLGLGCADLLRIVRGDGS